MHSRAFRCAALGSAALLRALGGASCCSRRGGEAGGVHIGACAVENKPSCAG